jgi:hypothetical protein
VFKKSLLAVFLTLALAWAAPSPVLADDESEEPDAGEMARDGIERLMRALEAFIDMIPQYEMPEINEDGDIIIRRKHDPEEPPEEDLEFDETRT